MQKALLLIPLVLLAGAALFSTNSGSFLAQEDFDGETPRLTTSYATFKRYCDDAYSGLDNNPVICVNSKYQIYTMAKTEGTTLNVSLDPYVIAYKNANNKPDLKGNSISTILNNSLSYCNKKRQTGSLEQIIPCVAQKVYDFQIEKGFDDVEFSVTAVKYHSQNSFIYRGLNLYSNYSNKRNYKGWDVYLAFY